MTILAVLKDEREIPPFSQMLSALAPDAELLCFGNALSALAAARKTEIDIALLDVELPELGGVDFGQYLQELYPLVNLIYLSEDRTRAYDAIRQHASGYLLRPASEEGVRRELDDLRHPAAEKKHKRVYAQTFGNFELFVDGKPVAFKYTRTKEIVALLINNRGAQTTNGEIIATLWEDDGDPEKGIILKQRGSLAIAADRIECDLFDWLEKRQESRYHYLGDYMNQYSWPEVMHAELDEISWSFDEE